VINTVPSCTRYDWHKELTVTMHGLWHNRKCTNFNKQGKERKEKVSNKNFLDSSSSSNTSQHQSLVTLNSLSLQIKDRSNLFLSEFVLIIVLAGLQYYTFTHWVQQWSQEFGRDCRDAHKCPRHVPTSRSVGTLRQPFLRGPVAARDNPPIYNHCFGSQSSRH